MCTMEIRFQRLVIDKSYRQYLRESRIIRVIKITNLIANYNRLHRQLSVAQRAYDNMAPPTVGEDEVDDIEPEEPDYDDEYQARKK